MSAASLRRSSLAAYLAIGALVVLASGALWVALGIGSEADAASATDDLVTDSEGSGGEAEVEQVTLATALPTIESVVVARDPFASIRPDDAATQTASSSSSSGESSGGEASEPSNVPSGGCRANGGPEVVCDGAVLTLLELAPGGATIRVDEERYSVEPGQPFAEGRFELLRAGASCAEIISRTGDEAQIVEVCLGATAK